MKKNLTKQNPVRVVVMIKGDEVVGVTSDGTPVDCLMLQLESGQYDAMGRPIVGMQRGRADQHRPSVDMMFAMSDETPYLPHDKEDAKRDFHDYMDRLHFGRSRNN